MKKKHKDDCKMKKIFKFIWLKILSDSLKVMGGKMDKIRLIDAINSSKLDYNDIYDKVNVIKKKKSNFNIESYNEIVYLQMYIYHLKNGINTLSKNGNIPELIPKRISYEQFKIELEKYKNIEYKNEVISEIKNLFQEIIRLANFKLLDKGYWTKIYSSSTSYEEVKETGKLYVSIDNAYLYQFACLLFTNCLKNGIYNYEFKVNNDQEINRTDNLVIYFTEDNLNSYLSIINELKQTYPEFNFNYSHILGKELSDGVAIAKDYKDGSSFTEKICSTILELRKKGYDAETIVNSIEGSIDTHLESVTTLISDEQQLIEDRKR